MDFQPYLRLVRRRMIVNSIGKIAPIRSPSSSPMFVFPEPLTPISTTIMRIPSRSA
jgi:hypothetical protein